MEDVVYIFERVVKNIAAKLIFVGDGPERQNVEMLCRQLGLCDHIRFLGKQDAVEELLAIADLFIMPSASESFGLSALEAMACEVPVISSNAGGLPEVNIHGLTGFLSNVGDVDDMAKNALTIIENDEIHQKFRAAALANAQLYSLENIVPHYEEYYRQIIEDSLHLK